MENKTITSAAIAQRDPAWNKRAIEKFLGEADGHVPNPVDDKFAPMRVFNLVRVEQVEETDAWNVWKQKVHERNTKRWAKRAVELEPELGWNRQNPVELSGVKTKTLKDILTRAKAYQVDSESRRYETPFLRFAGSSARANEKRLHDYYMLDFLVGCRSEWDERVMENEYQFKGWDRVAAYLVITEGILEAVANRYPELQEVVDIETKRLYDWRDRLGAIPAWAFPPIGSSETLTERD